MKERPILFTGAMVRALLDGSKTQTRRLLRRQPYVSRSCPPNVSDAEPGDLFVCPDMFPTTDQRGSVIAECESIGTYHCMGQHAFAEKHSPYGVPGDRLWVREAWAKTHVAQAGQEWFIYREDDNRTDYGGPWKPSIHMPRAASRILLEIVSVRVERLQDIGPEDCRAEGISQCDGLGSNSEILDLAKRMGTFTDETLRYATLWEQINGAGSWDANPWVWVVEFKLVTP